MLKVKHDFIGKRFGHGIVIAEMEVETVRKNSKYPRQYQKWKLKCDCGKEYSSSSKYLMYGQGTHCGCLRKKDLLGKRFGSAEVIRFVGSKMRGKESPRPSNVWELQCDCGKVFQTHAEYLTSGCTSSCGCKRSNFHWNSSGISPSLYFNHIRKDAKRRKHSFNVTNEQLMTLLNAQKYKCNLSGKCISFNDGSASLDRIDSSKGYSIDNVQWVHRKINYMKHTLLQSEFIELCKLVSATHID